MDERGGNILPQPARLSFYPCTGGGKTKYNNKSVILKLTRSIRSIVSRCLSMNEDFLQEFIDADI